MGRRHSEDSVFKKDDMVLRGEKTGEKIDSRKELVDVNGMINLFLFLKSFSNFFFGPMLIFYRFINNKTELKVQKN